MVDLVHKFFSFFFTYELEFRIYSDRDEELLVDAHYSMFNVLSDKKALLVFGRMRLFYRLACEQRTFIRE